VLIKILESFDFPEYYLARQYYPRIYHKTDKLGRPIYIERLGLVNVEKLFQITTLERMVRNHVYEYEKLINYRLKACSIKFNRYLEQSVTILDLCHVKLSSFPRVYSIVHQITKIATDNYPEM
jgi:hypothetical protein